MEDNGTSDILPKIRKPRLTRLLASSRLPYLLMVLSMILSAPALRWGIYVDDYLQRLILLGKPFLGYVTDPWFGLFDFIPADPARQQAWQDAGLLPWWSHPEIRLGFFRPLAAAAHILDYSLWPNNFVMQHAHNLIWYALGVLTIALAYRRTFKSAVAAGLAAMMFAVEDSHAMPVAWLAGRNSLMTLFFAGLALLMHIEWRKTRAWVYFPLALTAFAAALLSGEAALGITAYFFAYQLFLDQGTLIKRMAYLVPYGILVVAWRVAYQALGFGVIGSDVYLDPLGTPLDFSLAVLERIPILMLSQWAQFPIDLWGIFPRGYQLALTAAGFAAMVILVLLFRRLLKASAEARFWALGMLVSLIPLCAGPPMDRMLIFAGIGAFGLLAGLADQVFFSEAKSGWLFSGAIALLLVIHLALAPVLLPLRIWYMGPIFNIDKRIELAFPHDDDLKRQSVIFINGNEMFVDYIVIIRSAEGGVVPGRLTFLAPMWRKLTLKRLDDATLLIRPEEGFIPRPIDRLVRRLDPPFRPGQKIAGKDFTVEVLEVTPDGRPAAAVFHFHRPLQDPSLRFMFFAPTGLKRFELPEVGGAATIPGHLEFD